MLALLVAHAAADDDPTTTPSLRNHRPCIVTGMPGGDVRLLRAGARGRAVLHGQHGRVEFR